MKLTATLFASIVTISAAASDDDKMIRGGGVVATAEGVGVAAVKTDHNVLRGVNFYEAAAQSDFEDTLNDEIYISDFPSSTNPCPACAVVDGQNEFCGRRLGRERSIPVCASNVFTCGAIYQCEECHSIDGYGGFVGNGAFRCV